MIGDIYAQTEDDFKTDDLDNGDEIWVKCIPLTDPLIRKVTTAQQLAEAAHLKDIKNWTDIVLKEYYKFEKMFSEEAAD